MKSSCVILHLNVTSWLSAVPFPNHQIIIIFYCFLSHYTTPIGLHRDKKTTQKNYIFKILL